ncbi:MAG: MotA/TolQ/ExbB proton channel family protein [Cryomorphaceae bacterium]|nr:MotA/TolQ/ExbB proton channel family protein [Cryomorphaceae bacterium]
MNLKHPVMLDYFYMGGPLFMGMLTLIFIVLVVAAVLKKGVKEIGLLALAIGFLGQFIGLFGAFEAIESIGGVSQSLLAGGLKVSSITSIYGLLIYIISLIIQVVQRFLK